MIKKIQHLIGWFQVEKRSC